MFVVIARHDSDPIRSEEFATFAAAKKWGTDQLRHGYRVNNASLWNTDDCTFGHYHLSHGRNGLLRWTKGRC